MFDCYLIRNSLSFIPFSPSLHPYVLCFLLLPIIIWLKTHNSTRSHSSPSTHTDLTLTPHTNTRTKKHIHIHFPESQPRCGWERYIGPEYEQASVQRRWRGLGAHTSRAHVPPEASRPAGLPLLRHGGCRRLLGPACRLHQDQTHRWGRERGKRGKTRTVFGS